MSDSGRIDSPQRRERALLAYGDPLTRSYLVRVVEGSSAHAVDAVGTGPQALEKLAGGNYEMFLLGLDLPELSGLDALAQLRADPTHAALPVIIATGSKDASCVRRAIGLGVSDYILKPFDEESIQRRIDRVLASRRRAALHAEERPLRLLWADRDESVVRSASEALSPSFDFAGSSSLADWILKAKRFRPDYAVIETELFGSRLEACLTALEHACRPAQVRLIASGAGDKLDGRADIAGELPRGLAPDALRQAVEQIVATSQPDAGLLRYLQDDLEALVRQAFSSTTGDEAARCAAPERPAGDAVFRLRLTPTTGEPPIELTVAAPEETARALSAQMAGLAPSELDSAQADQGVQELANLIGGGFRRLAIARKTGLEVGLPQRVASPDPSPDAASLWFSWRTHPPFVVVVEAPVPEGATNPAATNAETLS